MHYEQFAYAFRSDLSLDQMFDRLGEATPWRWAKADSDRWGDYLSTRAMPDYAMVKIFDDEGRFLINASYRSERADAVDEVAALRKTVLETVLPSIAAVEVTATDSVD
jgi:hypothetical protein